MVTVEVRALCGGDDYGAPCRGSELNDHQIGHEIRLTQSQIRDASHLEVGTQATTV